MPRFTRFSRQGWSPLGLPPRVLCALGCNRFTLAAIAVTAAAGTLGADENWPQCRAPGSQGISSETQLPTEWAPGKNVAWTTELPAGHSSPIVW
jgi:hypothetical protein